MCLQVSCVVTQEVMLVAIHMYTVSHKEIFSKLFTPLTSIKLIQESNKTVKWVNRTGEQNGKTVEH